MRTFIMVSIIMIVLIKMAHNMSEGYRDSEVRYGGR